MSPWKVLAATSILLIPLAFASVSFGDGIEHRDARPTVVLPSLVEGPQVTMRPTTAERNPDEAKPDKGGPDRPPSSPPAGRELTCTQDDDDDDDGDDDEVEVVQPCPDAVGDDDDDDDDGDDSDGDD